MAGDSNEEWPPPEARLRSVLWRAEEHLERREYVAAARTLAEGFGLGGDEELLHGLHHLAAAGYRAQIGELDRARRQLEHARRRLREHPLIELVERDIGS